MSNFEFTTPIVVKGVKVERGTVRVDITATCEVAGVDCAFEGKITASKDKLADKGVGTGDFAAEIDRGV